MTYYSLKELFGAHHLATLSDVDMGSYLKAAIDKGTTWFHQSDGSVIWQRVQEVLRNDTRASFRSAVARVFARHESTRIIDFPAFTATPLTDDQRLSLLYSMSLTSLCLLDDASRRSLYRLMFPRYDELIESEFYKKEFAPQANAIYNGCTNDKMEELIGKLRGFYSSRMVTSRSTWITQQLAKK